MKIVKKSITALSATLLVLGFASTAFAQGIYGSVNSATQGSVQVGGNSGSNAGISDNATINVGLNVGAGASDSNSNTGSSSSSADISTQGNVAADVSVGPITITRADVDSNIVSANTKTVAAVKTSDDLSGFVAAQIKNDDNVSSVDSASDHVAVTYTEAAKLFGFIPVTLDATAKVDANGNVSISYPWYAFLATKDASDLQANIQSRVNADLAGNVSGSSTGAQLSASQQAKLIADVKAAMHDELNASMSASANASGNVSTQ